MRLHCLVSRAADLVDRPAVAAHRFHFIGKPAQRLVIGVDVERDAAIKSRNRIVPCGCPCPVSDMLGRDISLRSGAEYLRPRICAQRCDMRSEEHTSELQSLMRISYAVFGLKNKNTHNE